VTLIDSSRGGLAHRLSPHSIEGIRARIEEVHREIATGPAPVGQVPLHIACFASDCGNGLHCLDYLKKGRAGAAVGGTAAERGHCRACLTAVAELPNRATEALDDVVALFDQQRRELIREHYWTAPMDQWAYNQAYRLGRIGLHNKAQKVVRERVGRTQHPKEGQQTTWNQDVIAYGQHAVAACCRQCVEYWHGIERGRPLTDDEVRRLTALVTIYLDLRLPDLPDAPATITPIRRSDIPDRGDAFNLREAISSLLGGGASPAGLVVPREMFKLLKTDVVVDEAGGTVLLRPLAHRLELDGQPGAEVG
jgi:Domain of unknown function (DUF4186)